VAVARIDQCSNPNSARSLGTADFGAASTAADVVLTVADAPVVEGTPDDVRGT
jgi:hypothetical protein